MAVTPSGGRTRPGGAAPGLAVYPRSNRARCGLDVRSGASVKAGRARLQPVLRDGGEGESCG